MLKQRTVKKSGELTGVGLHSGQSVVIEVRPAAADTGIVFVRSDLPSQPEIPARPGSVIDTTLATRIGLSKEVSISTIEHFMAALYALGIDNVKILISSAEVPIMDGSALPFLVFLDELGVEELEKPKSIFTVKKTVEIVDKNDPEKFIRIEPSKTAKLSYAIDFGQDTVVGKQLVTLGLTGEEFCKELCYARTFCRAEEVEYLRSIGLARGGSLENALVFDGKGGLMNENGLRSQDEFVRHKALDCVGDLALLGMPIVGHIIAHKAGHDLHTQMAKLLQETAAEHTVWAPAVGKRSKVRGITDFPLEIPDFSTITRWAAIRG